MKLFDETRWRCIPVFVKVKDLIPMGCVFSHVDSEPELTIVRSPLIKYKPESLSPLDDRLLSSPASHKYLSDSEDAIRSRSRATSSAHTKIRDSRFRHVFGELPKLEQTFHEIRISTYAGDGNGVAANHLFVAANLQVSSSFRRSSCLLILHFSASAGRWRFLPSRASHWLQTVSLDLSNSRRSYLEHY
jgi:hypothetical protein